MAKPELIKFCTDTGLTVDVVHVGLNTDPAPKPRNDGTTQYGMKPQDWHHDEFRVTLRRGNSTIVTTYKAGIGNRKPSKLMGYSRPERHKTNSRLFWVGGPGGKYLTEFQMAEARYTVPVPPTVDEVLQCLLIDASCVENSGGTFEEFCQELGYDEDSRRAEAVYNACLQTAVQLRSLLGNQYDCAVEAAQDY